MKHIYAILTAVAVVLVGRFTVRAGPLDKPSGQRYTVVGKVFQKATDGVLVECNPPNSSGYKKATGIIFLSGHPDFARLIDGSAIKCTATEKGTYEYTSVNGAKRTVGAFAFAGR